MKTKLAYTQAHLIATDLLKRLSPFCGRIEIAGSIRRRKTEIGDIEIVAIPKPLFDMFGNRIETHELDTVKWDDFGTWIKGGHKYKQIELKEGITLDLFIVTPPAEWGIQFLLRTGPQDYSHRIVTPRNQGGLLPGYLKVQEGAIWSHNHIIPTPEEVDVYNLLGIPYTEPECRE